MSSTEGSGSLYHVVERESSEVMARNLRIAARLFASAMVFAFIAFLFAFFYLRALDTSSVWQPATVKPSMVLGIAAMLTLVVAALMIRLGLRDHRADRRPAWRIKGAIALALLIVFIVVQFVSWTTQAFGPSDGPYASVFFGWTVLLTLFVAGLAYWLETTLATSIRYRNQGPQATVEPGHASGDSHRTAHDIDTPVALVRPALEAVTTFSMTVAGIGIVSWIILYLL